MLGFMYRNALWTGRLYIHGFVKVRYRYFKKDSTQLFTLFALPQAAYGASQIDRGHEYIDMFGSAQIG